MRHYSNHTVIVVVVVDDDDDDDDTNANANAKHLQVQRLLLIFISRVYENSLDGNYRRFPFNVTRGSKLPALNLQSAIDLRPY